MDSKAHIRPTEPSRTKLNKRKLDTLLRSKKNGCQRTIWDEKQTGLCVLVSPGPAHKPDATVTFRVCYYLKHQPGKPHYIKLGRYPDKSLEEARDEADSIRKSARKGIDPKRPVLSDRFEEIVEEFIDDHAKRKNKHWKETQRVFNRYVLPEWRDWKIGDIKRGDVTALLKKIERKKIKTKDGKLMGGPVTADRTLAAISKLMNWYALEKDDFRPPIVKGMRRTDPKKRARSRVLSDSELRIMWPMLGQLGVYGAAIKCALLTAQRFFKAGHMRRSDVKDSMLIEGRLVNNEWVPPMQIENVWDPTRDDDPENKQVAIVPLSQMARRIIDSVPIVDAGKKGEDWVFSLNGKQPLKGWSKYKKRLDDAMLVAFRKQAEEAGLDPETVQLKPWQHRDLRRTARTLLSRAGVDRQISELCLAHVIKGVEGVYDRYDYLNERRVALEKLASLIDHITNPPEDNVIPMTAKTR